MRRLLWLLFGGAREVSHKNFRLVPTSNSIFVFDSRGYLTTFTIRNRNLQSTISEVKLLIDEKKI